MCSLLGSSWGCSGCILLLGFTDTDRSTDQVFKMSTTHGRASSTGPARFSSASPTRSWRRIDLRRRQRLARGRRRSQLVADRAQYPDTRQQREPVAIDDVVDLAEQRRGLVAGQIERHAPNVGSLTLFAESTVGASGNIGQSQSATGTFFLCSQPYWPIFGQFAPIVPIRY